MKNDVAQPILALPLTRFAMLAGAMVSAWLAPKKWDVFISDFAFYWVPQAGILALLWALKFSKEQVAAVALVLAVYLSMYGAWLLGDLQQRGIAGITYLAVIPGAFVGPVVVRFFGFHNHSLSALSAFYSSFLGASLGLGVSLAAQGRW